jgi:hypothetical protein
MAESDVDLGLDGDEREIQREKERDAEKVIST